VTNGVANSQSYTTAAVGTFYWVATYNGDTDNNSVSSGAADEAVVVNKASPGIVTVASPGGEMGKVVLNDTAKLSGGFHPTGTITFTLTAPNNTMAYQQTVTVNGDGNYSTSNTATAAQVGVYHWTATYSGDGNNKAVSDNGTNESATVNPDPKAQIAPTGTTAQQFANGTAPTLPAIFYSGNGTIGQSVNPGVFFYFSYVVAPNPGTLTITITEWNNSTNNEWPFLIHQNQIGLYNASGTTLIASGQDLGHGTAKITTNATSTGQEFIVCVKYNAKSIVGGPVPIPAVVQYTWTTWVNGISGPTASVKLAPTGTTIIGPISLIGPSGGPTPTPPQGGSDNSHGGHNSSANQHSPIQQSSGSLVLDQLFSQDPDANDVGAGFDHLLAKLARTGRGG
jgi:hypothetical protein